MAFDWLDWRPPSFFFVGMGKWLFPVTRSGTRTSEHIKIYDNWFSVLSSRRPCFFFFLFLALDGSSFLGTFLCYSNSLSPTLPYLCVLVYVTQDTHNPRPKGPRDNNRHPINFFLFVLRERTATSALYCALKGMISWQWDRYCFFVQQQNTLPVACNSNAAHGVFFGDDDTTLTDCVWGSTPASAARLHTKQKPTARTHWETARGRVTLSLCGCNLKRRRQ